MQVIINGTDITKHINETSYKIDAEKSFTEWTDGNFIKHRVYVRERVVGSFDVVLYGRDGMYLSNFLTLFNSAVNNNIVTLLLYVNNLGSSKIINAYYDLITTKHVKKIDGTYMDIVTVTLEER